MTSNDYKAVIIVTYEGSPWINECLDSLVDCDYPLMVCMNKKGASAYDSAGVYYAKKHGVNEFVLLHDSMVVKDSSFIKKAFELKGNVSLSPTNFLMCAGKFETEKLPPLPPMPTNKLDAIRFECSFMRSITPDHVLFDNFNDTNVFVQKHGKQRMVLENDYLIKYKGTWSPEMVREGE